MVTDVHEVVSVKKCGALFGADLRPNQASNVRLRIEDVGPSRLQTTPERCDALHRRPVVFLLWLKTKKPKLHIMWIL